MSFNALNTAHDIYAPGCSGGPENMDIVTAATAFPMLKGAKTPMMTELPYRRTRVEVPWGHAFKYVSEAEYDLWSAIEDDGPKV